MMKAEDTPLDYRTMALTSQGEARHGSQWDRNIFLQPMGGSAHLAPGFPAIRDSAGRILDVGDCYFETGGTFAAGVSWAYVDAPWSPVRRGCRQRMRTVVGITNYGDENLRYLESDPDTYQHASGVEFFIVPVPLIPAGVVEYMARQNERTPLEWYWNEMHSAWRPIVDVHDADCWLVTEIIESGEFQCKWHWMDALSPHGREAYDRLTTQRERHDFAHRICVSKIRLLLCHPEERRRLLHDTILGGLGDEQPPYINAKSLTDMLHMPWNQAGSTRISSLDMGALGKRYTISDSAESSRFGRYWARHPAARYPEDRITRRYQEYLRLREQTSVASAATPLVTAPEENHGG